MEEWKLYKLSDVTNLIGDGIHGTPKYDDSGSYFFINGNNLENGKIVIRSTTKKVNTEEALKHRKNLSERTILVSINGTIGNTARYNFEPCILGKSACYLNVSDGVDVDFIYYVVSNQQFKDTISRLATGTTIKNVSLETMRNYEFFMPSLKSQKKISGILKSIDDKIELNRQINDNLEQQLQSLYREWFIENPKADWTTVNLSEIASFTSGYSYKGNELVESSDTAMATIKNFERNGGFKIDGYKPIVPSAKLKIDQRAQLFDILVAHTDLTQNAEVIGNAEILLSKDIYKELIFSMDLVKVSAKGSFPFQFLLALLLKNPRFKSHCIGYVNGTTVLHMNKRALPDYETIIPNSEDAQSLNATAKAIFCQMSENLTEISNLTKLRDTLLPKLMSGELKINEIDC